MVFTRDTCSSHTSTDSRCWSGAVLGPGVGPRCGPPAFFSSPLHSHCGASAQTQRERERKEEARVKGGSNEVQRQVEVLQLEEGCECHFKMLGVGEGVRVGGIPCSGWSAPPMAGSQVPFSGYDTHCSCIEHLNGRRHGHATHNNGHQQVQQPGG